MNYFLTWFIIKYSYVLLEYLKNIKKYENKNKYRMIIRKEKRFRKNSKFELSATKKLVK